MGRDIKGVLKRFRGKLAPCVLALLITGGNAFAVPDAEDRRQAKRIHDRLAGSPPSPEILNDLAVMVENGDAFGAALKVMTYDPADPMYQESARNFYNITVKNMATPWTNEAQTVFAPLNDYSATVIGMVRDETPFNTILSANVVYVGNGVIGLPPYSMDGNDHYEYLEDENINLGDNTQFVAVAQSSVTNLPDGATAGVLTTRAAARAFFIDGTNRAMFRFTLMNHLCTDLEPLKDASRPPDRIQQDVSRSPGGDSRLFFNNCLGCHAGMDPLNQAFAYYDYVYPGDEKDDGRLVYTPGSVQGKYLINANNFKYGYVTTDDSWVNYWRAGPNSNSAIGWGPGTGSGYGAKSLGIELANTNAFATCQVRKVFKTVCFREPNNSELGTLTSSFLSDNYNMKRLFAHTADTCKGN